MNCSERTKDFGSTLLVNDKGLKLDKKERTRGLGTSTEDVEKNVIFISREYHSEENERERDSFECEDLSWCRDSMQTNFRASSGVKCATANRITEC